MSNKSKVRTAEICTESEGLTPGPSSHTLPWWYSCMNYRHSVRFQWIICNICPIHLSRQNDFCPGQNQNCLRQNIFCPEQKILYMDKKFIISDELYEKWLFSFGQNFLSWTKMILFRTIFILSWTKIILSEQMDRALLYRQNCPRCCFLSTLRRR